MKVGGISPIIYPPILTFPHEGGKGLKSAPSVVGNA